MKPTLLHFSELSGDNTHFDFHIHTDITDGTESPATMVDAAIEKGLKQIAFTEHVTRETTWYDSFAEKIFHLRKTNSDIVIYLGAEAKAIDSKGNIDIPMNIVGLPELLVGVVHRYPDGRSGYLSLDQIKKCGPRQARETEFKLTLSIIQNTENRVDVIGHPFGVYSKLFEDFPADFYETILMESLKYGKAIEINTKYLLDKNAVSLLKRINPCISLGSDAHSTEDIARSYDVLRGFVGT